LAQRIGVDLHESGFAFGGLPAASIGGDANELPVRQNPIDPLGAVAPAVAAVRLRARRVMTGINAKHGAS
jgi:hypothetical protein